MIKLFILTIFFAIASCQTSPATDTAVDVSPPPGIIHNAECTCFARVSKGRLSTAKLLGDLLNHSPKPEVCDGQGMADCIKYCEEKVAHMSNGFDLNVPPKTREGLTTPLGQYICNLLGLNVRPSVMTLYAELNCHTQKGSMSMTSRRMQTTNARSKQALECLDGKFIPADVKEDTWW